MSVLGYAYLYSGPNKTGASYLTGLGVGDRYAHVTFSELATHDLLNSVASGEISCANADLNVILFGHTDYTGAFFQLSKSRDDGNRDFWHTGQVNSALLIASHNRDRNEVRVSFVETMRTKWDNFLDDRVRGTRVSRVGEPLLTWRMFPEYYGKLDSNKAYLRIDQHLEVDLPFPWSDYAASMVYHVLLYLDNARLRAWVANSEVYVEDGAKHDEIQNELEPAVRDGAAALQNKLNEQLSQFDALGAIQDVFYLPGKQLQPIGTNVLSGKTDDDITIVVVT